MMRRKVFPPVSRSLRALRAQVTGLFLEQNAILVLTNHQGRFSPSEVTENVAHVRSIASVKELRAMESQLRVAVADMRSKCGVSASPAKLLDLMTWLERNVTPGQACYMPQGMLSDYLSHYDTMQIPPHARISIDWLGVGTDYPGGFEIRLLEASLFEDMCALYNSCRDASDRVPKGMRLGDLERKMVVKRHAALKRATMSAAFYFVEGYINCLASDYVHKHRGTLGEKEKVLLTEWDAGRNRFKSISTRDKLVQYPRIVTRSEFPPLDENNCPELAYFVSTAKDFRDSVVHASASLDPLQEYPRKEVLFGSLEQRDVDKIVDTSVALVRKIEKLVYGDCRKWLQDRDIATGVFPDAVFE